MVATKITCGRVRNLGNYESLRMEVTAELEEGEDPKKCMEELYAYVDDLVQMDIEAIKIAKSMD